MNTTYSMRVENELKKQFLEKSKKSGVDGSTLVRYFMKSYVERDDMVSIDIEEKLFDEMFQNKKVQEGLKKLISKIDELGF